VHFTYQEPNGDLQQGDVLEITSELRETLNEFHPYYASHKDYRYLMVLTQSCDLARHDGHPCKARYITLAVVRSLETVLNRELGKHQRSSIEVHGGLCSVDKRRWIEDFLVKLLNNNNPEYFYLAEDISLGLDKPHVAFLKLAVPVKSKDHYKACLKARIMQLKEIFQAKLGWLVGNMYSRVGTPDWVPAVVTEKAFADLIEDILEKMCLWVDKPVLQNLQEELKKRRQSEGSQYNMPQDEVIRLVRKYAQEEETRTERNIDVIMDQIRQAMLDFKPEQLDALRKQLTFNEEIRRLLK